MMSVIERRIAVYDLERHIQDLMSVSRKLSMDTEKDLIREIDKKVMKLVSEKNILLRSDLDENDIEALRKMLFWFEKNKYDLEDLMEMMNFEGENWKKTVAVIKKELEKKEQ